MPALSDFTAVSVSLLHAAASPLTVEEAIFALIGKIVLAAGTNHTPPRKPGPAAIRRMPRVIEYIDNNLASDISLTDLSGFAAMSKYHFLRTFKHATGLTPHQYILGRRMRRAAMALRATQSPIAHVAADQGFGDLSTFNHSFRRVMGVTPTAFRSRP